MTRIHYATNRLQPRGGRTEYGDRFNSDGPQFYEVGYADVAWDAVDAAGMPSTPDRYKVTFTRVRARRPEKEDLTEIPEMHRKQAKGEQPGSHRVFHKLRERMSAENRDAIVFIHGFANDFDNAIARAAWISEYYLVASGDGAGRAPEVMAFSWPSDGMVQPPWKYASDRDDAALSGVAMARALRRFIDFLSEGERCLCRLHLVAHSMGNWALRHAVLGVRQLLDGQRLPKIFDNAFLMAADEDDDCFETDDKLGLLPQLARNIHVYHSANDLALDVSDHTKFNRERLGSHGPRSHSGISTRITSIDCSKVDFTEVVHGRHQYYRLRDEVIEDVRNVLSGRFRPDEIPNRQVVEPGRRYRIKN